MQRLVLVVDDEPLLSELLADMLRDMGCEVWAVSNGADALDILQRNPRIDVLITDLNMPGMDGHELVERAQRLRRGLQVLLMSGRESDGHGYPIVRKPFVQRELREAMSRTIGLC